MKPEHTTSTGFGAASLGRSLSSLVDLAVVVLYTAVVAATILFILPQGSPLRFLLGLPLLFFLPGYVLLAVLFPRAHGVAPPEDSIDATFRSQRRVFFTEEIDLIERAALSFGMSIALLAIVGVAFELFPYPYALEPILAVIVGFIVLLSILGGARRVALPEDEQFRLPLGRLWSEVRRGVAAPGLQGPLNVVLAVSVLLGVGVFGYALAAPTDATEFTSVYLVTEDDSGEFVSSGYPTSFVQGESQSVYLGLENHEGERATYTVVVTLDRVKRTADGPTVLQRTRLDRFERTVDPGGTVHVESTVAPEMLGENLRLTYLVYKDDVPSTPSTENAYRSVHLWIDVTSQESGQDAN